MFSKYDEIYKLLRDYIEDSFTKPMASIDVLNGELIEKYGYNMSTIDISNLSEAITFAKKCRMDYDNGVRNSQIAITDWTNALEKSKEIAFKSEGKARSYAKIIAEKACISTYKGAITLDIMKELKEHNYDGSYGSTTMVQMYALYTKCERLEEKSKTDELELKNQKEVNERTTASYRSIYIENENNKNTIDELKKENETLKIVNSELINKSTSLESKVDELSDRVKHLSEKLPIQIIETFKSIIGKQDDIGNSKKTM